jgi:hypothetical protein
MNRSLREQVALAKQTELDRAAAADAAAARRDAIAALLLEFSLHWLWAPEAVEAPVQWQELFTEWLRRLVNAIILSDFQKNVAAMGVPPGAPADTHTAWSVAIALLKEAVRNPLRIRELVDECGDLFNYLQLAFGDRARMRKSICGEQSLAVPVQEKAPTQPAAPPPVAPPGKQKRR